MADQRTSGQLSPTVIKVLNEFVSALRGDEAIPDDAISRLEELLLQEVAPKPEEISDAIFQIPGGGEE